MLTPKPRCQYPIEPRGVISRALLERLVGSPGAASDIVAVAGQFVDQPGTVALDEDLQLSLWLLYELHYRGLPAVDDRWEWHPDLIVIAALLEEVLERDLRVLVCSRLRADRGGPEQLPAALRELVSADTGPSLSRYLARSATRGQYAEFLIHRSLYHLKEADPHSWAIPRLAGPPKVALVEIQSDEYGGGRPEWMHAELFADSMRGFGLDHRYGAYLDQAPAATLMWANTMTMLGLHRRFRGAVVGHLAALEMTSSLPNRRYGTGLRRLGMNEDTTRFFDEHVEADAVHEQIAAHDLAGGLAQAEPGLVGDILFGAASALATDEQVATHLLQSWRSGESSLRRIGTAMSAPAVRVGPRPQPV